MVLPLNNARLTVDVSLQLLDEGLATPSVAHRYEITLHSIEELLLVDVTIQVAQDLVASIVAKPIRSVCARSGSFVCRLTLICEDLGY
jgi:hypothetical protein